MGLYGSMKVDTVPGVAYPGVTYDNEVILFLSEIDPALRTALANGTYGTAAHPAVSYEPKYFLINGQPYPNSQPILAHSLTAGEKVLIRFLSAALETHVPTLHGPAQYMSVLAEDGNPYPYPKTQYSVLLPAGKTMDALLTLPSSTPVGTYVVYDRRLALTNSKASPGGMLVVLAGGPPPPPTIVPQETRTGP
jgi:hypothetical protein